MADAKGFFSVVPIFLEMDDCGGTSGLRCRRRPARFAEVLTSLLACLFGIILLQVQSSFTTLRLAFAPQAMALSDLTWPA